MNILTCGTFFKIFCGISVLLCTTYRSENFTNSLWFHRNKRDEKQDLSYFGEQIESTKPTQT